MFIYKQMRFISANDLSDYIALEIALKVATS